MRNSRPFSKNKGIAAICFASIVIFLSPLSLIAQAISEKGLPFITNYSPKTFKALPQTWCIIEDGRGIMYFGVQATILEYDGVRWRKIIFNGPAPAVVRSLARDKNGTIYYGAAGDFGYLMRDSVGQTRAISLRQYIPAAYRNFFDVWTIHISGSDIYFQSREYIFRINEKREVKTWVPKTKFMYAFFYDDNYFVHESNVGLLKLVKDSLQLIPGSEFLGRERVQVMLPYNASTPQASPGIGKQYILGMFYAGMFLFDDSGFRPFKTEADELVRAGTLYKGAMLSNGNYVLSTTGKGLVIIDASGKILQLINRDVGLQDESVYGVYSDSKGTLWLALDNGISRVETASPLTQFTNQSGINTATLSIQRFEGKLYLGTTNGLLRFNELTGRFDPVSLVPPNQTFNLVKDGNTLLVANDGLFSIRNGKPTLIRSSVGGDLQLSGLFISKNHPDMLLGGATFGVAVFSRKNSAQPWQFKGHVPKLDDQFWTFSENKDGTVWAGTQSGAVYLLTPAFDKNGEPDIHQFRFERFGEANGLKNSLGAVYHIKGESWFVGDSALYKFDEKQKRFYPDTVTFGRFPNGGGSSEFDMIEDAVGRVWLRFGKETILATPQPDGKYRIDKTPLLPISERTIGKIYPESNGIVWICTTDGLVRYDENLQKNYDQPFKTLLRQITAGNNLLNPVVDNNKTEKMQVAYNSNTLRFEYATPFFEQEDKTLFQTWLEGFEEGWSTFDNNYYKEYTNLPAGKYHFHVRAKNVYQKLSEESVFSFTIKAPWYASWWAYTLYACAAISLIGLIVWFRTRQLKEKHKELEETVALRTAELSHRVKELGVINSVQEGLVKEMGMQDIYEMVGEKIRAIFNAQIIDIVTYDSKTNLMEDRYSYEKGDRTLVGKWEPAGFRKHVIDTGQPFVINKDLDAISRKFNSKVIYGEQPKSAVFVPLITGNEVKGMISLQNLDKEMAFPDSDVSLLTTLANSMSVALESARRFDETNRLLKETEQRNAELAVINSVQESLVAKMDIQGIYELVGEKIREIFDAQVIDIVTYDKKAGLIEDRYAYEKGDRTMLGPRAPNGFRKHVIETGQILLHNRDVEQKMKEFGNEILIGDKPKSQMYVPMVAGNEIKGVISLQNLDHEDAFSNSDVSLLTTLANSMSVALESARLFDETNRLLKETEQRNAELAVINSVQDGLVREMDMQGIYDLVGEKMREIFDAQVIDIVTYDRKANLIEDKYSYEKGDRTLLGPREPKGFRKHVIQTRQVLLHNEHVEQKIKEFDNEILIGEIPKSQVYVPLVAANEVTGVISLQNVDHEHAFTESDVSLLTTLANSMSVALESARLFDETNRLLKETEQRTAELAVINSVQDGLAKELDMEGIYNLVGDRVQKLFDAQVTIIATFDFENKTELFNYFFENNEKVKVEPRPINKLRQLLIDKKHTIYIPTKEIAITEYGLTPIAGTAITKSLIFVPLLSGNIIKGYVSLQNIDKENAFSESDIRLLETLSNSMSVALENARLFDETSRLLKETEQRNAELAVINSVQESLVAQMDMQGIYVLVGEKMREIFNAQVIDIVTYDKNSNLIEDRYAFEKGDRTLLEPRPPKGFRKHVIETGQLLVINKDIEKLRPIYDNTVMVGQAAKSIVLVPMIAGGEVTGVISLQNLDQENAFSDSDISLLSTLVNSMSVALKSARLFDETTRLLKETELRKAELATINSVQDGLVKEFKSQGIYELVGEKLCQLFDTQTVLIRTFDKDSTTETWQYAIEKGKRHYSEPRPLIWANKQMIRTHQPILINENYVETAKKYGGTGVSMGQAPKSAVFVPMIVADKIRGSVSLQNVDKEHAFNEADVKLLSTITSSMGVALENARLFDETTRLLAEAKQRASELGTVNNISQALTSQLNTEQLIKLVGDQMKDLFRANIVYLALLNSKTKIIHFPYMYGDTLTPMKLGKGLTSKIILSGKPLLINKEVTAKTEELGITHIGVPAASYLGVPIPVGEEIIGVLSVQSTESENRFNENDERLLSTIAASVGVALRKAQLFEELTLAKQQAEEASQTADKANQAKSAFLSTVSHELRTPLTSVLGFAKIIKKRLEDKIFPATNQSDPKTTKTINQVSENLDVVISEGERLTNLINEVLDLAKIEAGKMEWNLESVSMQEIMERAIAATTSLFEQKNLELEKFIEPNLPLISGDRDKLIQVVVNLISNAVKFTPSGKVICRANQQNDEIVVGVEDTGIGIAPQDHDAVFEQFKQVVGDTLTDKPKGTGLGLPICKEIVEHHGGRIWLKSEPGKGSTFFFALPLQKAAPATPIHLNDLVKQLKEQMAQSKFSSNGHHATILVVDDDDSIRSLLYQELGDAGYIIEEAKNGKEALASIRNHRPDLVILDIMMPEMNGFDVAAILKNDPQTMDIPIIVLSIVQDKARGFRIGVDRYLTKPIDTAQLFTEVGSLLEQGKSKKKVMVVDEDTTAVRTLTEVLQAKGYQVVESDGKELVEKAIINQPDIIILNSVLSAKQEIVQSLRFEKGLENVLFLIYQ
ncbi:GAF domain-containing protein [Terrimonas alba]|uniref:GAF domain-containing protein n=1 Tax=Terrimonas alba TaxID=3349636 RepID=UPI0035F36AA7